MTTLNGTILILNMGLQQEQIQVFKMLKSRHFSHIHRFQERFRELRNIQNYINKFSPEDEILHPIISG